MIKKICVNCEEVVDYGEQADSFVQPMHIECAVRIFAGSIPHQLRQCSCFVSGGSHKGDDPKLSKRENAKAAYMMYQ